MIYTCWPTSNLLRYIRVYIYIYTRSFGDWFPQSDIHLGTKSANPKHQLDQCHWSYSNQANPTGRVSATWEGKISTRVWQCYGLGTLTKKSVQSCRLFFWATRNESSNVKYQKWQQSTDNSPWCAKKSWLFISWSLLEALKFSWQEPWGSTSKAWQMVWVSWFCFQYNSLTCKKIRKRNTCAPSWFWYCRVVVMLQASSTFFLQIL